MLVVDIMTALPGSRLIHVTTVAESVSLTAGSDWICLDRPEDIGDDMRAAMPSLLVAGEFGDRPAFRFGDSSMSYAELMDGARRAAALGLRLQQLANLNHSGSYRNTTHRIAIHLPVCATTVALMVGSMASGSLVLFVGDDAPVDRITEILGDFVPHAIVTCASCLERLPEDTATKATIVDFGEFEALASTLQGLPTTDSLPPFDAERPALVAYTSGSTGEPKGAVQSHGNLSHPPIGLDRTRTYRRGDHIVMPGSWNHAVIVDIMMMFRSRLCVHYLDAKTLRFPAAFADYLERSKINFLTAPQSYYTQLLKYGGLEDRDLSALHTLEFWGEPVYSTSVAALLKAIPWARVVCLYDCAEALSISSRIMEAGRPDLSHDTIAVDITPGVEHRLILSTDGEPEDREGQIEVTGHSVTLGYWHDIRDLEVSAVPPAPRTLLLQDRVKEVGDARYLVLGRLDGIVKISGHRVSIGQVEAALASHPAVTEAAVFSLTGSAGAERIHAAVEIGDSSVSERELLKHCQPRLSKYSVPAAILMLERFPRIYSGKADRPKVRTLLHAEFSNPR